jgi:hypothetical protein
VNGSVTTGDASEKPVIDRISARSSSVVAGVMRSTIVETNETLSVAHAASSADVFSARSSTSLPTVGPLSIRLSHGTIAIGPAPADFLACKPSTTRWTTASLRK